MEQMCTQKRVYGTQKKKKKKKRKANEKRKDKKMQWQAFVALAGARTHVHKSMLHTSWYIFKPSGLRDYFFREKKHHEPHTAHARCTRGTRHTRPNVDEEIPSCPCEGRQELQRPIQLQRDTSKYINTCVMQVFEQKTPKLKKQAGKKKKKKQTSKDTERNACRGSDSRPQTKSWTGGLFLSRKKASYCTRHTARSASQLGW